MVSSRNAAMRRAAFAGGWSCALLAVALAAGCGGGGGGSTSGGASTRSATPVNVYVTDALTDKYSQVLVTLYGIDVSTDGGSTYTSAYVDADGATIDLASLSQSAQLLSRVTLPSGTITNVRLTFSDSVSLVPTGGGTAQTVTVSKTAPNVTISGDNAIVTYATSTKLTAAKLANLVVDFKLASFELVGNDLKPAIGDCDPNAFNGKRKMAYIPGTVDALAAGTSFTLDLAHPNGSGASTLTVDLSSSTTISSGPGNTTGATLTNGDSVLVAGSVDQTTGVLTAQSILIVPAQGTSPSPAPSGGSTDSSTISAIGTVQSVDTTTGDIVLQVHQGEHFPHSGNPAQGSLTVATGSSTVFESGPSTVALASVTTGSTIAVVGTLDSSGTLTATNVILLPAASMGGSAGAPQ